jgi:hypothetical protein
MAAPIRIFQLAQFVADNLRRLIQTLTTNHWRNGCAEWV